MRLTDSKQAWEQVTERLSIAYGHMITDEYLAGLMSHLRTTEAEIVIQAVNAHIENTTPAHDRRPIGSRPPAAADLLEQIARVEERRRRGAKYEGFQLKYGAVTPTPVPKKWQARWREALQGARANIRRREEICRHLRRTCGLNFLDNPLDVRAWTRVECQLAKTDYQLTNEQAVQIFQAARDEGRPSPVVPKTQVEAA